MKDKAQPEFPLRLLRIFCPAHLHEEIEGDLLQRFKRDVKQHGIGRARRRLMWNTVRFFRPGILLRNRFSIEPTAIDLLLSHVKFSTRILLKDKFFTTLNIAGLMLGIAVGIILLLILQNDLTYDRHYLNHNKIYRVSCHQQQTGLDIRWARSAFELGAVLEQEFPEIQAAIRVNNSYGRTLVTYEESGEKKAFYEDRIMDTDAGYFSVFNHLFITGDPATCLRNAHDVVITRTIAAKYFGNEEATGRTLFIDGESWKVTAVIDDMPGNTHLKFDLLLSNKRLLGSSKTFESENLWNPGIYLYILVPDQYRTQDFYAKFPAVFDKYFKSFGVTVEGKYTPILEPLADIHFGSDLDFDEPRGNKSYLYGFTVIGTLIMLLASINYMNLSTAKSVNRATEIAVKKVVGLKKHLLVLSFMVESVLMSLIALFLSVGLVYVILNVTSFNALIGKDLAANFFGNRILLFGSLGIAVGIGLISGIYPAFYLPSIPTLKALKGSFKNSTSSHLLRKVLITAQFAISILVVVCTLLMRDQIDYIQGRELGFNKDNIMLLTIRDTIVQKQINSIKDDFLRDSHITAATVSYGALGMNVGGTQNMWVETNEGMRQQGFTLMFVGDDYLKTMGMSLVTGRDFQTGPNADVENAYIVNEAAAKIIGKGLDPLGKKIKAFHGELPGQVIGVVRDFNFKSLHNKVEPLLLIKAERPGGFLHLKVKREDLQQTIHDIQQKWTHYDPGNPFEYFFLDKRFEEQYRNDQAQNTLLSVLSAICIFISLLGLIGLSAFTATQRTKEIGVRKVLGANVSSIIFMLSKDVLFLVILAAILVFPVSWWVVTQWMENFAYKTRLDYLVYVTVALAALGFVFLTISFQSLKTARANPVDSLKYE